MSRGFKISRQNYDYVSSERVDWLDRFADSIEQASQLTAVEVARRRNQVSIHDQINSIITRNPSSSFATVEDKVNDMQERVGLSEYLRRVSAEEHNKVAQAENFENIFPNLNKDLREDIISFCKNKIANHRGQITVPAIQHDVLDTFRRYGLQPEDVNCEPVAKMISGMILKEQQTNPARDETNVQLGLGVGRDDVDENDADNTDFFQNLMPNNES